MAIKTPRRSQPGVVSQGGPARPEARLLSTAGPSRRRRPAVIALGVALALAGGLVSAQLVSGAQQRVPVLALARDVPKGQPITQADLATAQLPGDPALAPIPLSQRSQVVGKVAAADLSHGSLLTAGDLMEGKSPTDGKRVVGIALKSGQMPSVALNAGQKVLLVATPAQDDPAKASASPSSLAGVLVSAGRPDAAGVSVVNVAVAPSDAPSLAVWAAGGHVALVVEPGA